MSQGLICSLPFPPTLNTYYSVRRGRKILSQKGRDYKKTCHGLLYFPQPEVTGHVSITLVYVMPDRRKRDLDNYLKPVLDALTECNIIEDDSMIVSLNVYKHPFPNKPGAVHIDVDSDVGDAFNVSEEDVSAKVIQFPGRKH